VFHVPGDTLQPDSHEEADGDAEDRTDTR
jgi:hypothetical protein